MMSKSMKPMTKAYAKGGMVAKGKGKDKPMAKSAPAKGKGKMPAFLMGKKGMK